MPGSVTIVDPARDSQPRHDDPLEVARLDFDTQAQRLEQARARLQATIDRIEKGRSRQERLQESAFARLRARVDSMPVIEQAKGILMAQHRCGPDQAFDLLRRASQRANVKVSVLAAQIVEQIASPDTERQR
jgi:two-component system, response regulator / RNA-binding antiterminator